jgi:hypothetical protein
MADTGQEVQTTFHRGREYAERPDGTKWSRKVNPKTQQPVSQWELVETAPESEPEPKQLSLVVKNQAEGEPKHWSLYVFIIDSTGQTRGQLWQVNGDAEQMHYAHDSNVDVFNSASFSWHQTLNNNLSDTQEAEVNRVANSELPPQAENRASVVENCQGWTMRVLWRLADSGIVDRRAVGNLQQYMDPIN